MEETAATRYVNSAICIAPEIYIPCQTQQPSGGSLPGEAVMLICRAASPGSAYPFLRPLRSSEPGGTRNCCRARTGDNTAITCHSASLLREAHAAFLPRY